MREYLKYSALFHFFTGASLDENQCSERAAAQASPLFLGSCECVRKRVCVRVQCRPTTPISSNCEHCVSMATTPTEQMRGARKSGHAGAMADARQSVSAPAIYVPPLT